MDSTLSHARATSVPAVAVTRRVVLGGCLLATACVLGLLEASIASPVPGVRFGLANIAVLVALAVLGEKSALAVSVLRVGVVGLATGSLLGPVSVLAVSGALASWATMVLAFRSPVRFTVVGISIAGAAAHVTAQFFAAALLSGAIGILGLATIPIIASLLFGIATGFAARYIISRLKGNGLAGR